jgi:hypothetical protein
MPSFLLEAPSCLLRVVNRTGMYVAGSLPRITVMVVGIVAFVADADW